MHSTIRTLPEVRLAPRAIVGAVALIALAWALATLDLRLILAGSALIGGIICALRAPWLAWAAIGAVLPFAASFKWGLISLLDLALLGVFALWFLDGARRRTLRLAFSAPVFALLIYLATLLLASLGARDLPQSIAEVIKWIQFAAVLLVLPAMVGKDEVRWVAAGALAGAAAQALLGLYQFVFRIGPEWFLILGRFMRASGTFAQPNPFAGYLGLMLPVAVSLTIEAFGRIWQQLWQFLRAIFWHNGTVANRREEADARTPALAWLWAAYCLVVTLIIAAGLLASWSRGGWLAAAVAGVIVIALRSRKAALLFGLAALLASILLLAGNLSPEAVSAAVPQPILARLQQLPAFFGSSDMLQQEVNDDNFALIERLAHWEAAKRMFALSPWLGVGAGNYAAVYPDVRLPQWVDALGHAHNYYLNVLAEGGVVGIVAFVLLWLVVVIWCVRQIAGMRQSSVDGRAGDGFGVALAVGVLGVIAHLSVHNLVDNLFVQGMYVQVAIWIALVAARSADTGKRVARQEASGTPETNPEASPEIYPETKPAFNSY